MSIAVLQLSPVQSTFAAPATVTMTAAVPGA